MRGGCFLAICLVAGGIPSLCFGGVKSYDSLTTIEVGALHESELRLGETDQALNDLDRDRKHGRISERKFCLREQELMESIRDEAEFQNAILTKSSRTPVEPEAVLRTAGKVAVAIVSAAVQGLAGHSFSP